MRRSLERAAVVALLGALASCAVLTDSQVDEVRRFSKATTAYTELPGSVIRAYGELRRDVTLLDVSRMKLDNRTAQGTLDPSKAKQAWSQIEKAYDDEVEFDADGRELDAQLKVLTYYATILEEVVSDEYTDALGESAARLGESLDDATKKYNEEFRAGEPPISNVGGLIAQGIRGAGGIYLRHRQAEILRETVGAGGKLIPPLMDDVSDTAGRMADSFANQENNLGPAFVSVGTRAGYVDVSSVPVAYRYLAEAREGQDLAKKVSAAAKTYELAHARLVDETREKKDLSGLIEEIRALQDEIKAANKIREKVEE